MIQLPEEFVAATRQLLGDAAYARLEQGLGESPEVSIRLNTAKLAALWETEDAVPALPGSRVPWCASGWYLDDRPAFTFDPLLHAGAYYVQEAGSMYLEQALKACREVLPADRPLMALDLCAAPGGKSTHLRSLLPEGSFLVSNEPMRPRAQVLSENMQKWGHPYSMVTHAYPAGFSDLEHLFDLIVTDVPCSGEGMFRKDEGAIADWSPENVTLCWQRQREILSAIWPALKPGGCLIYSTCTFNALENEDNVAWIARELGAELLPLPQSDTWGIRGDQTGRNLPVAHFMPGWTRGEGFFLAVLHKKGNGDEAEAGWRQCLPGKQGKKGKADKKGSGKNKAAAGPSLKDLSGWVAADAWQWIQEEDRVAVIPACHAAAYEALKACVPVLHAGVPVAEQKGRDWQPCQGLALSEACNRGAFQQVELTYEQAIAYLRKEALVLPENTPKGYVLLTYRKFPLGFAKQIGNRANNLYPDTWRIRSGYVTPCAVL